MENSLFSRSDLFGDTCQNIRVIGTTRTTLPEPPPCLSLPVHCISRHSNSGGSLSQAVSGSSGGVLGDSKATVITWYPAIVYGGERESARKRLFLCDCTTTVYYCTVCVEKVNKKDDTREREDGAAAIPDGRGLADSHEPGAGGVRARLRGVLGGGGRLSGGAARGGVRRVRPGAAAAEPARDTAAGARRPLVTWLADASRPWLCYWIVHSLALLDALPDESEDPILTARVVDTLKRMQRIDGTLLGGFGGGPGQLPHCAPTYAATLALVTMGTEAALATIDRKRLYRFLLSMRTPEGAFRMHDDGEVDTRAAYTALSVASLTNILTPELSAGTAEWIAKCQTFEGGFGAEPFNEAHGGYSFCAVAALAILDRMDAVDLGALLRWVTLRQMPRSGGFQGRGNKLVDACYSFWQGSTPAVLSIATHGQYSAATEAEGEDDTTAEAKPGTAATTLP